VQIVAMIVVIHGVMTVAHPTAEAVVVVVATLEEEGAVAVVAVVLPHGWMLHVRSATVTATLQKIAGTRTTTMMATRRGMLPPTMSTPPGSRTVEPHIISPASSTT
jgi:hypothetical protein